MMRYVIFGLVGPFVGGFLLLLVTTTLSGYWTQTDLSEVAKLFVVFVKSLQSSYLFGILPVLIFAAIDDIVSHIRWIGAAARMLTVGIIAFVAAGFLYGGKGADSGFAQFVMYGMVGLVPAMLCSRLARDRAGQEVRA